MQEGAAMNGEELKCQVCGCTEERTCVVKGEACHWISPGVLCSACLDKVVLPSSDPVEMVKVLEPLGGVEAELRLLGPFAFQLLATIQLACRHPEFSGATAAVARQVGEFIQSQIAVTPQLAKLCDAGWKASEDVPRLVLPGRDY